MLVAMSVSTSLSADWEAPTIVHRSYGGQHAWFSEVAVPSHGALIAALSLGGDGTTCPPPGKVQNCSMALRSLDGGRSWLRFSDWSHTAVNEVIPMPNGSFVTIPYGLKVDYSSNTTAVSFGGRAHLDRKSGEFVWEEKGSIHWLTTEADRWPFRLVHSGSVVELRDSSLLTTCYGHGDGMYRTWAQRPRVYFMRSTDWGRTWVRLATVPWQPAYGNTSDGPGEPTTARLADGRLMCVFRADASSYYWATFSLDEGKAWSSPHRLDFAWSVKPRLRLLTSGILVLTGGRPGIDLWASADGGQSWHRWSIPELHNSMIASGALAANYSFDPQVVNASGPKVPRAQPQPQTSSYTGLAEASDGALVVSYDRLANGWKGPPGVWGECDTVFTMRVRLAAN
jgi:hypothetical protein